jgi:hypothetical protein
MHEESLNPLILIRSQLAVLQANFDFHERIANPKSNQGVVDSQLSGVLASPHLELRILEKRIGELTSKLRSK